MNENMIAKGFQLTRAQLDYLAEGSYGFVTQSGKSVYRDLKVVAQDKVTNCVIIKESYFGDYNYEKSFLLSPEGRTEKLRLVNKSNPINSVQPKFQHQNFQ